MDLVTELLFGFIAIMGLLAKLLHRSKNLKGFWVLLAINVAWGYISIKLCWWPNLVATIYFVVVNICGARVWKTGRPYVGDNLVMKLGAVGNAATTIVVNVMMLTNYITEAIGLQTIACALCMYGYLLSIWKHRLTYVCFSISGICWMPIAIVMGIWPLLIKTVSYLVIDALTVKTWWRKE